MGRPDFKSGRGRKRCLVGSTPTLLRQLFAEDFELMLAAPISKDVVLLGGGHAHVFVLKSFGMKPEPGVRLTLVAKELSAPYSGMLPGFVAGHYTLDECHIDLVRLAHFAGARIIHGQCIGVDRIQRRVLIEGRPPLGYDLLSIDVGITPEFAGIEGAAEHAIAVKPVSVFAPKWQELEARALTPDGPRKIAVIGGGAAGVELVLAAHHRLRTLAPAAGLDPQSFSFSLVAGDALLPSLNTRARALARHGLSQANVVLIEGDLATRIFDRSVKLASGRSIGADAVLISTKAAAPSWFADTDLSRTSEGFLDVRSTLQLQNDNDVFGVGDCANVAEHPRAKSGVFAVRQGPIVAGNLRRRARGEPALPFVPQTTFLTLISLGGKRAIAARGTLAGHGRWAWNWKDRIDRAFMDKFNKLPSMTGPSAGTTEDTNMRCGGCAAKIGPVTLSAALDRLELTKPTRAGPKRARDDAAIIDDGGDPLRLETVDFFRAFWPDPFVFGEIAANHAMSDIFAMGGTPRHAMAIAVLPFGKPRIVAEDLFQLLAGAKSSFDREGVEVVGGHSSEGAELSVGFSVSGSVKRSDLRRKGGLKPGDQLILTRPLGTGILFAAHMRGLASAAAIETALITMRRSNRQAAAILRRHGATAMTDVTGFGLGGHLIEMLHQSGMTAKLFASVLPTYPTVTELAQRGIVSTLQPENAVIASQCAGMTDLPAATLAVLFDPQTSGGLLAGVPADNASACLDELWREEAAGAAIVGEVSISALSSVPRTFHDIEIVTFG